MGKIIKKEFTLAMHPIVPVMILLSAMVMIPNYPYIVIFFYVSMSVFFTCLLGRENHDIEYSMNLPISKASIVKGRIGFVVTVEMIQMVVMIPFAILRQNIMAAGNQAGMDANITLFAEGFIVYGLFNLIFFTSYYKNVNKVGISFLKGAVMYTVAMVVDIGLCYGVPFVKNVLDTPGLENLAAKLVALVVGVIVFVGLTFFTVKKCEKSFNKLDL